MPDVVADHEATLGRFKEWLPRLSGKAPLAFVAQNGVRPETVPWDEIRCLFLGGTTQWKVGPEARRMAEAAKRRGKLVHMGRVNSYQRIRLAWSMGCDSVDGGMFSMFADTYLPRALLQLENLEREMTLWPNVR